MPDKPALVWFRNDLRLRDNAALRAAAHGGRPVVALYVLDDGAPPQRAAGAASRWWLLHSLKALSADLAGAGIELVLRRGPAVEAVAEVIAQSGAAALHFTRAYTPWGAALEERVEAQATTLGVTCHRHSGFLLFEPDAITTAAGEPFRVFTPFARACRRAGLDRLPQDRPARLRAHPQHIAGERLEDWSLYDGRPDWAHEFAAQWRPGEAGAQVKLHRFVSGALFAYADRRDRPDEETTSRLSPHLHFGELSPLQVWHAVATAMTQQHGRADRAGEKFLSEILWREFCYHLLAQAPALHDAPFNARFAAIEWRDDAPALSAWQRGATGIPIVDAGMRQLWRTGWMHNRVRMIAASFLSKNLLLDWRQGERWFWDTLVDADAANNPASWQWVAGTGADAAPYFRIFNPLLQGERFDPQGAYVRRFVPELAHLPARFIHRPWEASRDVLAAAGVTLGETYPTPIVDLKASRERALAAYGVVKNG